MQKLLSLGNLLSGVCVNVFRSCYMCARDYMIYIVAKIHIDYCSNSYSDIVRAET